jgi:type III pantothenate kinase
MTCRLVADVGNTRVKWGRIDGDRIEIAALATDDPAAWAAQWQLWQLADGAEWAVAGVHPDRRDRLLNWLEQAGAAVRLIADYRQLPIRVEVSAPEKVGIDRLLNAVAAAARVPRGTPAVIIDAGSAVTVDLVDETGAFRGGAIFPGLAMMARSLHQFTAKLPLIEAFEAHQMPGTDTEAAIRAGVFHAVCGGIDRLVEKLAAADARVFLAGGDTTIANGLRCRPEVVGPVLTLDGIRRTAWPEP